MHVEGMEIELSSRGGKEVLRNLFSKITRLYLDGGTRKSLRDSQVETELLMV